MIYSKFSKISVSTIKSIRFLNLSWRCDAVHNARSNSKIKLNKVAIVLTIDKAHTCKPIGCRRRHLIIHGSLTSSTSTLWHQYLQKKGLPRPFQLKKDALRAKFISKIMTAGFYSFNNNNHYVFHVTDSIDA
jgi:hypothetical protein